MAFQSLEEQLRRLTECKICFEEKEHQKQLPCQHTLCLDCLTQLKIADSKYQCSICLTQHFVPNGGMESLPESLVTKQLAELMHSRDWSSTASGASAETNGDEYAPTTEAARSMVAQARKGKDVLKLAEAKINTYEEISGNVTNVEKEIQEKLQSMAEELIAKVRSNVEKKTESLQEVSQAKKRKVDEQASKLQEAYKNAKEAVEQLENKAKELESSGAEADASNDLKQVHALLEILKDQMKAKGTASSEDETLKVADSVTLKPDVSHLSPKFLEDALSYTSVGYLQELDEDDGDCTAIFPENSSWRGKVDMLEKSVSQHNLPTVGDKVRIRKSVQEPHYEKSKPESVGYLIAVEGCDDDGRDVKIDFPEDHEWRGLFDEIEMACAEPLKVGDRVWMGKLVQEPTGGWNGVTRTSIGTLLSVNEDTAVVNFPENENWQGLLSEIEHIRPVVIGDKVRVLKSVESPKTGWGQVTHAHEGIVKMMKNNLEHGSIAVIDFPNVPQLWMCVATELEIIERHPVEQEKVTNPLQRALEASNQMTRQLVDRQCETQ